MRKIHSIVMIVMLVLSGLGAVAVSGNDDTFDLQTYENSGFEIIPKYSSIRSYRNGGGIFIIHMKVDHDFSGTVLLRITADPNLNAQLSRRILNKHVRVAEITINPNEFVDITTYQIELTATHITHSMNPITSCHEIQRLSTHGNNVQTVFLDVEMFLWSSGNLPDVIIKRDELINWLEGEHPEFGNFSDQDSFAYCTYPQILIVEHWTFLYKKWEMRICYHVMIPPYDWSMLWLRKRGDVNPIFAAYRESDGTTYEIPVSEYPTFYGY